VSAHESEIAVLSILLKNQDLFYDFPEDLFSSEVNRNIYRIMKFIREDGKDIDPYLIKLIAKENNLNIGGDEYIDVLLSSQYSSRNFEDYIHDLERNYKKRKLFDLSLYIRDALIDDTSEDNVSDIIISEIEKLRSIGKVNIESLSDSSLDLFEKIAYEVENGILPGFSSGFQKIDAITSGIRPGNLWVIAGRPGMGKSSWLISSARNTDYNKIIFSLEMSKEEFLEREFSIGSGVPLIKIRSRSLSKKELDLVKDAATNFKNRDDIFLTTKVFGLSALEREIRSVVKHNDVKVVYIDYVQLLAERNNESTHEIGRISRKLKLLARELGIGIILLSQLNRNVELRDNKRPILSDLRQSGNLEEDADIVGFLYRDEYYDKNSKDKDVVEFIIAKQRNGPVGTLFLKMNKSTTEIYEE